MTGQSPGSSKKTLVTRQVSTLVKSTANNSLEKAVTHHLCQIAGTCHRPHRLAWTSYQQQRPSSTNLQPSWNTAATIHLLTASLVFKVFTSTAPRRSCVETTWTCSSNGQEFMITSAERSCHEMMVGMAWHQWVAGSPVLVHTIIL